MVTKAGILSGHNTLDPMPQVWGVTNKEGRKASFSFVSYSAAHRKAVEVLQSVLRLISLRTVENFECQLEVSPVRCLGY